LPFRVLQSRCSTRRHCCQPTRSLAEFSRSFRVFGPTGCCPHGLGRPALPLAHLPGCAVFTCRTALKTVKCSAASSLRAWAPLRALPSETWPSSRSSIATLVDFRAPWSTCEKSGPTDREFCLLAMFRPQGLGDPRDGLLPAIRAGLVSCRQRSWDIDPAELSPPGGWPRVFRVMPNPPTVFSSRIYQAALAARPAPQGRGSWVHFRRASSG
jgi:hypothetical protein